MKNIWRLCERLSVSGMKLILMRSVDYFVQLITNAAGTRVADDDIVRLFLDWLDTYHEAHLAVVREIYRTRDLRATISGWPCTVNRYRATIRLKPTYTVC